ncbi:MAG: hypothetical protein ACK56I_31645 [bacterium]
MPAKAPPAAWPRLRVGERPGSWDLDPLQLLEDLGGRRLFSGQKFRRQCQRRPVH